MKLPNWFRIIWWLALLGIITYIIVRRHDALVTGQGSFGDVLVLLIWVALFLAPVFQEVGFFGIKLKQHLSELKQEVDSLRTDIRNTIDVQAHINPTFNVPLAPPDAQLPVIEERFRRILDDTLKKYDVVPQKDDTLTDIPENTVFLFKARYLIEREINRIWEQRMSSEIFARPGSISRMATDLANEGFIPHELISIIRDVYAAASPVIHGKEVSKPRIDFIAEVVPELIAALKAIQ
jgi:hypothetical protein